MTVTVPVGAATGPIRVTAPGGTATSTGTFTVTSLTPLDFYTLNPCRLFDTRNAGGPTGGAPLTCGADYTFTIVGGACGVPADAKAVSLNVTVTSPTAQGNVRLFASGTPAPLVSTQNYVAGQTRGTTPWRRWGRGGSLDEVLADGDGALDRGRERVLQVAPGRLALAWQAQIHRDDPQPNW